MSSSSSSLGTSGDGRASLEVRINRCCPPPEHWTKVKELNVENREPCEVKAHTVLQTQIPSMSYILLFSRIQIWRSGVHHQLAKLKEHMVS